jgi:hypothetical protein
LAKSRTKRHQTALYSTKINAYGTEASSIRLAA